MTLKEIEELAGHRQVPAWVVKLVGDAVAVEREACANMILTLTCMGNAKECFEVAACYVRARGRG